MDRILDKVISGDCEEHRHEHPEERLVQRQSRLPSALGHDGEDRPVPQVERIGDEAEPLHQAAVGARTRLPRTAVQFLPQ